MLILAILNTISTVALAIITFFYARINARMLGEMRRAREMASQPMLSVTLVLAGQANLSTGTSGIKAISLRNIGNAPAVRTRIVADLLVGDSPYKKGELLQGQLGNEEREIPLAEVFSQEDVVQEMIKQIHKGKTVTRLTFRVTMSYSNSCGILFESSQVFDKDLQPQKPEWKLLSQEHRVIEIPS